MCKVENFVQIYLWIHFERMNTNAIGFISTVFRREYLSFPFSLSTSFLLDEMKEREFAAMHLHNIPRCCVFTC